MVLPGDNAEIYVWEGTLFQLVFLHLEKILHGHPLDNYWFGAGIMSFNLSTYPILVMDI